MGSLIKIIIFYVYQSLIIRLIYTLRCPAFTMYSGSATNTLFSLSGWVSHWNENNFDDAGIFVAQYCDQTYLRQQMFFFHSATFPLGTKYYKVITHFSLSSWTLFKKNSLSNLMNIWTNKWQIGSPKPNFVLTPNFRHTRNCKYFRVKTSCTIAGTSVADTRKWWQAP